MNNDDTYTPPKIFKSAHLQTIYPYLARHGGTPDYIRERIETDDNDFLDLDWLPTVSSKKLVELCHGLEGSSKQPYMVAMAKYLRQNGFDILAWNFRSCSEEPNLAAKSYHAGMTSDLDRVIRHAQLQNHYQEINLVGFSLGGNLILKYLGENKFESSRCIHKAVTFSVPCCLEAAEEALSQGFNKVYSRLFTLSVLRKARKKKTLLAEHGVDLDKLSKIKSLRDYDEWVIAPLHGYQDHFDYWQQNSAKHFLKNIKIPTLIVNALDDPMLLNDCYPHDFIRDNKLITLETPETGGHIGFVDFNEENTYWSEKRTKQFLMN